MIRVKREQQVLQEGIEILLTNMEPSSFARFWAACSGGKGDYLKIKDQLFAEETVDSLYDKVADFQSSEYE